MEKFYSHLITQCWDQYKDHRMDAKEITITESLAIQNINTIFLIKTLTSSQVSAAIVKTEK